jgi:hypothetical protein
MKINIQNQIDKYKKNKNYEAIIKLLLPLNNKNDEKINLELLNAYQLSFKHKEVLALCEKNKSNRKTQLNSKWISAKAIALVALNNQVEAKNVLKEGLVQHSNDAELNLRI